MTEGPILLAGIAILAGVTIVKWLVFTGLLWIAIKVQKMQYNVLGLFGSSLLATLIGFIPFVGTYLAWAVLVVCLWKVTREDIVPDCVLTVALANAVMFALNLWVIGALMGDLRPGFLAGKGHSPMVEALGEDAPEPGESALSSGRPASPAEPVRAMAVQPKPASTSLPVKKTALRNAAVATSTQAVPQGWTLKGLILDAKLPSAMIALGKERFTIQPGESILVPTVRGHVSVRCQEITQAAVRLDVNDGQEVILRVR